MTSPYEDATQRVDALLSKPGRRILGLAGPPGSGKSTLAARLGMTYQDCSVVVPMDGFHLANIELERLGRAGRKGAPDTFDASGFVALLHRLRAGESGIIYAPLFQREIEEPIAGAIPIPTEARLIIVEGNYLLCDDAWAPIRTLLDEAWFVDTDKHDRESWLAARHMVFGRTQTEAQAWIAKTDAPNAALIEPTRARANWIYQNVALAQ
ncbi:nucleoside/nucleotide kinase family protein [Kozakia baliensis]|uniref:Nucleoside/nucleotide kinase family protein n=1 Tax=Kozakia baliensis TaxID=153496 RepID=A0A1D8USB3_9PROT|nr:nucleoside/nucleotide kinase family protein [Kozakia baliensis]AOX16506.1 nucleoside/nucleotide kinase family protein [Kozakia baliensis]GBR29288.1 panthothenate kinase [Kozakia baliensis NRIC 0488]GEL63393.1 nucleoside/nucleotide kinase family protein [Kozakia baliensis]